MRMVIASLLALSFSAAAWAAETDVEIRPIQDSSTDVFDILNQLMSAKAAYNDYDYATAFEQFRYVYLHDPQQEEALLGYANSALALGKVNLAQNMFHQMQSNAAVTGQVLTAILKGEVEHVEPALRHRLQTQPKDGRLWNALGREFDRQKRFGEARQAYVMGGMTKQRPGLAENNIGQSFLSEGNLDKAKDYFARASQKSPQDRRFDNNLRLLKLMQKDYVGALNNLPSDRASSILMDAGVIALKQDDPKLAQYLFKRAQRLSPVYDQKLASYIFALENKT